MTLGRIVDQVYLAVTGGVPTDDVNVHRLDIRNLAPTYINEAADKHLKIQLGESYQDYREYGVGRDGLAQDLYLSYTLTLQTDTTRGRDYVVLPAATMYLPGDAGFRQAYIPEGDELVRFVRLANAARTRGLPDPSGVVWMWVEKTGNESRVYFKGLGLPKPTSILVRAALDVSSFSDDAELPLTDSIIAEAIRGLTDYFLNQRVVEEDVRNTAEDEKQNK